MNKIALKESKWRARYFKRNFRVMIKPYLSKDGKHLDFGCRFGYFAYLLAKDYPRMQVIGVDIDKKVILQGRKRYKRKNLKLIATNKIPGKFDSISCCFVLHEIKGNLNSYLKEFYKHLKEDGKIIVLDFRKVPKKVYLEWYKKKSYEESFESSYKKHCKWTPKQLADIFKKIGFKPVVIKPLEKFWLFYVGGKNGKS